MQGQIAARICIAALGAAALGLSVMDVELALAAEPEESLFWIVRTGGASPISRCLATWDRTSGMSKQEWKATC